MTTKFYVGLDVHEQFTQYAVRSADGSLVLEGKCSSRFDDVYAAIEAYLTVA